MIATRDPGYGRLEVDSSNLIMEWDHSRVLGRYEQAAHAALQAGKLRERMGDSRSSEGDLAAAARDWLSAAECFIHASAEAPASVLVDRVERLATEGQLPADRPDLVEALRLRSRQLDDLRSRVKEFFNTFGTQGFADQPPGPEPLALLVQQVRGLAGMPLLHYALYRQASALGQRELAERHLAWAATFDTRNPNYTALLGYSFIAAGKADQAEEIASAFLQQNHEDTGPVRILLANALTAATAPGNGSQQRLGRALDVLKPLLADANLKYRLAALALSTAFQFERGNYADAADLLRRFNEAAGSVHEQSVAAVVHDLHTLLPKWVSLAQGDADSIRGGMGIPNPDRLALLQSAKRLADAA